MKKRLTFSEVAEIEKALSSLPYPLKVERAGRAPVKVIDQEGNFIQLVSYNQLAVLLLFIQKNCMGSST
jgi:hypothetical protein